MLTSRVVSCNAARAVSDMIVGGVAYLIGEA